MKLELENSREEEDGPHLVDLSARAASLHITSLALSRQLGMVSRGV